MQKWGRTGVILFFAMLWVGDALALQLTNYVITDNYVGADPTNNWPHVDVIGAQESFDVSHMKVSFDGSRMTVNLYTTYLDNIGLHGTQLGDLFVSTDGWRPFGEPSYPDDEASNGETWEYALTIDNHLSPSGGNVNLYAVTDGTIAYSWAPHGYVYRAGQEVQFTPRESVSPLAVGTWSIVENGDYDILRFDVTAGTWGSPSALGFHWGPTCANDVIEGEAPASVPEPSTLILLGSGLAGLFGLRRKSKKG